MAFYELRRYRVLPGKMDDWVRCMEETIIPFQVARGMVIAASFRGESDDQTYMWMRRFDSEEQREQAVRGGVRVGRVEERYRATGGAVDRALHDRGNPARGDAQVGAAVARDGGGGTGSAARRGQRRARPPPKLPGRCASAGWSCARVRTSRSGLDGGLMFGTVPRTIWGRSYAADDSQPGGDGHPLPAGTRLRRRRARGVWCWWTPASATSPRATGSAISTESPTPAWRLLEELAAAGIEPDDVTHVVLTHLHFDHAGGAVRSTAAGPRPTFPAARYLVHERELAYARAPDRRSRASYLPETWEPLADAGVLATVAGEAEVIPGVRLRDAPGHTDHHQVVTVSGGGRTVLFTADLFPYALHLKPHYVPAIDLDPRRTMATRRR